MDARLLMAQPMQIVGLFLLAVGVLAIVVAIWLFLRG